MESAKKPVPQVNPYSQAFWEAAREGRLTIQKCTDCGQHVFYPRLICPHCHSDSLTWVEASGRGTVPAARALLSSEIASRRSGNRGLCSCSIRSLLFMTRR